MDTFRFNSGELGKRFLGNVSGAQWILWRYFDLILFWYDNPRKTRITYSNKTLNKWDCKFQSGSWNSRDGNVFEWDFFLNDTGFLKVESLILVVQLSLIQISRNSSVSSSLMKTHISFEITDDIKVYLSSLPSNQRHLSTVPISRWESSEPALFTIWIFVYYSPSFRLISADSFSK